MPLSVGFASQFLYSFLFPASCLACCIDFPFFSVTSPISKISTSFPINEVIFHVVHLVILFSQGRLLKIRLAFLLKFSTSNLFTGVGCQPYDTNPQLEGPGHLISGFPSPRSVACTTALESDLPLGFCQGLLP